MEDFQLKFCNGSNRQSEVFTSAVVILNNNKHNKYIFSQSGESYSSMNIIMKECYQGSTY